MKVEKFLRGTPLEWLRYATRRGSEELKGYYVPALESRDVFCLFL